MGKVSTGSSKPQKVLAMSADYEKSKVELMQSSQIANVPVKVDSPSGYRKRALEHYKRQIGGFDVNTCVMCGFGVPEILEIAHLDQDRKNNAIENLAPLCPNCHKMHDLHLIPTKVVIEMRDLKATADWKPRMKDAGMKAALTRRKNNVAAKRSAAGKKAWKNRNETKKENGDKDL